MLNSRLLKISSFIIVFLFSLVFVLNSQGATCTITKARWGNSAAAVGQTVSIIVTVNEVQSCRGVNVGINIFEDDTVSDDLLVSLLNNPFSGSDTDFTVQYKLTAQDYAKGDDGEVGGETIYFTAAVSGQTSPATSSNINFSGQAPGVRISFDVNPKNVGNTPATNKATAINKVDINLLEYGTYCGNQNINSFKYFVMWDFTSAVGARDKELYSETISFPRTNAVASLDFNKIFTVSAGSGAQKLYGMIECPSGKNVTESGRVDVFVGMGQGTWSCVGPNSAGKDIYICSQSNLTDCSDTPQCAGKTCSQIPSQLCGKETGNIPPPGGGGACNNNGKCDPGETAATCPFEKCPVAPGQDVTFNFSLDNPLQANNIVELIDVIATWLFMIAIPIAVAMIVYAGIIFLISRGDTTKVTQARNILLYAVVGLAIILIGKGFITLIESVLELGTGSPQEQSGGGGLPPPLESVRYDCNNQNQCVRNPNGRFTSPTCNGFCD